MRIGQKTTFPRMTFPESDTKYVSHNVSRRITNAHLRACAWARMRMGAHVHWSQNDFYDFSQKFVRDERLSRLFFL